MNIHFIKSSEKKELIAQLEKGFGISDLPYLLLESGKDRIRAFSGSLSKEEIMKLAETTNIEAVGIYLIRKENELRLSFDACQLLSAQINKSILEIKEEDYNKWLRGFDLDIKAEKGTLIIRYNGDFLGCGRSTGDRIANHVPKERRLRK